MLRRLGRYVTRGCGIKQRLEANKPGGRLERGLQELLSTGKFFAVGLLKWQRCVFFLDEAGKWFSPAHTLAYCLQKMFFTSNILFII